jgi:hypothetical protein
MKILIGTPAYDGQVLVEYHLSILNLLMHFGRKRPEVEFRVSLPASTLVAKSRNHLASKVLLDESYTHLLFIDADMGFRPELIEKMIDFHEPYVGAIAPRKHIDYDRLAAVARARADSTDYREVAQEYVVSHPERVGGRGDFLKVDMMGAGILLLKREVLERMRQAHADLWTDVPMFADVAGGAFQPFVSLRDERGVWLSEDFSFCQRWKDLGGEVWACFNETITHVGRERFVGNYERRLRAGV